MAHPCNYNNIAQLAKKHGDPYYVKLGLYKGELDLTDTNTSAPMARREILMADCMNPADSWIMSKVADKDWGPKIKAGQDMIMPMVTEGIIETTKLEDLDYFCPHYGIPKQDSAQNRVIWSCSTLND